MTSGDDIAAASGATHRHEPLLLRLDEIGSVCRADFESASRESARPLYVGDHVALCRILSRYKLYLDTRDTGFAGHVLLDGYWEAWLTQFMARQVRPGMTAIDVGANFGYYSMLLGDLVGPGGKLLAIEPNPLVAELLRRSLVANGLTERTELVVAALGADEGGSATLFVPDGEPKNARIVSAVPGLPGATHEIGVRRLDALTTDYHKIDFLKIDAEGAEEAIIEGMAGIFATQRPTMILEFNAARYADPRTFADRIQALYPRLRFVDLDAEAKPLEVSRLLEDQVGEDWLLFLSPT